MSTPAGTYHVDNLSALSIDCTSRGFDFGSAEYPEQWEFAGWFTCEECDTEVLWVAGRTIHPEGDECEGEAYAEGPMMNYLWALPDRGEAFELESAADAIGPLLPLCAVELQDTGEIALALTGGGMDLSWEIAEAYIRLGYLPPFALAPLPDMAGYAEARPDVAAAMVRTCEVMRRWVDGRAAQSRALLEK